MAINKQRIDKIYGLTWLVLHINTCLWFPSF